jgi:hypothetical protein
MRRPPDVGKAALYTVLLLGVSGCAGISQHTTGSSPWTAGSDGQNTAPPGLFSWWHGRGAATGTAPSDPSAVQETGGRSQGYSDPSQTATSPWPETQSEWMARNFPRMTRFWNGTPAPNAGAAPDAGGVMWTNRVPDQTVTGGRAIAATGPRSDGEVRPTDSGSLPAADPNAAPAGSRTQSVDELPFSSTPPPVRSPRQTAPEPADSQTSAPSAIPLSSTEALENDGARRVSFESQDAPQVQQKPGASDRPAAAVQPGSTPKPLEGILPAPMLAGPQESAAPAVDGNRTARAPAALPDADGPASSAEQPANSDTRMAQIPPAPPVVPRTPPAPSPSGDAGEAASPPAPPASPAAPAANPAGAGNATGAPSTPAAPAAAPAPASAGAATGQRPWGGSGQAMFAPPPPMAPEQPRHHILSWLFHDDDDAVLTSAQAPSKTTPTMYSSPQHVLPTGQGNSASCDSDCKAPKKPCFLKVWIHDWKNSHGSDCGSGDVCPSPQTTAACDSGATPKKPCFLKVWLHDWKNSHGSAASDCGPAPVYASPQADLTACETAVKAPKKPCFLKVWIHDWKNGHGSGCGGCQNGNGSCCQTGKCCAGGTPVAGSAQGGIATAQSSAAH